MAISKLLLTYVHIGGVQGVMWYRYASQPVQFSQFRKSCLKNWILKLWQALCFDDSSSLSRRVLGNDHQVIIIRIWREHIQPAYLACDSKTYKRLGWTPFEEKKCIKYIIIIIMKCVKKIRKNEGLVILFTHTLDKLCCLSGPWLPERKN